MNFLRIYLFIVLSYLLRGREMLTNPIRHFKKDKKGEKYKIILLMQKA